MQFRPDTHRSFPASFKTAAHQVATVLKRAWQAHCRLVETSVLHQTVMVLISDTIAAKIDLMHLLQLVHELLLNLWAGRPPA